MGADAKKCRKCKQEIDEKSSFCPHCGKKQKEKGNPVQYILAIALWVTLGYWIFGPDDNPGGSIRASRNANGDIHGAWAYMQLFVEEQLKSPNSAEFPFGGYRDVTPLGDGRYKVSSYVDAENAFGATMRTHFEGVIKRVPDGWELEYLRFKE